MLEDVPLVKPGKDSIAVFLVYTIIMISIGIAIGYFLPI